MIFTFSSKGSKPEDTKTVLEIKEYCEDKGINFSAIVIKQMRAWHEQELTNVK